MVQRKAGTGWILLLSVVSMVWVRAGADLVPADVCWHGMTVSKTFLDCAWAVSANLTEARLLHHVYWGRSTLLEVESFLPFFCGTVLPGYRQCFEEKISNCNDNQRQELLQLADDSGYFCLAGSNIIHPTISTVLASLSDRELNASYECGKRSSWYRCDNEAQDVAVSHLNRTEFSNLPFQLLMPIWNEYYRVQMQCIIRETSQEADTCPDQWRGVALRRLFLALVPWATLGVPLPLTLEDLVRSLQLPSPSVPGQYPV